MESIAQLVREHDEPELLERITVLGIAAHNSAAHRGLFVECSHGWIDDFSARLAAAAGNDVDELYVVGAATALVGAEEAALRVWIRRTGGEINADTIELRRHLLADAIARLGAGFDTL